MNVRTVPLWLVAGLLALMSLFLGVRPALAQSTLQPVVRAVLFTSPPCTFCRQIVEQDLPPVIEKFGSQLQIIHVDVNTPEGNKLYEAALAVFNLPRGVPVIFVGETALGGVNLTPKLPALVETYLAKGGVDWPDIPGLDEYLTTIQATLEPVAGLPTAAASPTPQPTTPASSEIGPVVHAVMLWMDGCPHCEEIIDNVLPPLREQYGEQFDLQLIEVVTLDEINRLYEISAGYGFTKEQTGVPFLVIGETPLVGSDQIRAQLPTLIEQHLAQGGVGFPAALLSLIPVPSATPAPEKTIVYIFWGDGCPHCEAARPFLRELEQSYPGVEIREYEVWSQPENQALFAKMAAGFGFEPHYVPTIFIGERYWEGFSGGIKPALENAVAACAETGCPDAGQKIISAPVATQIPTTLPDSQSDISPTAIPSRIAPVEMRDNGFTLAIVIMVGIGIVLIYSLVAFALGKTFSLPAWGDWFIPVIIVIGIGVAGYLSFVETQSVAAMCGPVGDCNAVQSSRYAKLFDILPVGVLGLLGYLGLLAAWLVRRFIPKLEKLAAAGFLGMAFFAVLFSLYLTYLEPFVIRAVCIWCLTSAVLVTLLLLLGLPPAVRLFSISDDDEETE